MSLVGAHVSASGGVFEAVTRSAAIKGSAFALFLKNEKRWTSKPYDKGTIDKFRENCKEEGYDAMKDILPHGSYLINLGNHSPEAREKSETALLDDLQRCELLGIGNYNLHPGSSLGKDKKLSIKYIAEGINRIHAQTKFVKVVLENMTGNPDRIVGTALLDLHEIIEQVNDKNRIGVCIDTCHSVAAGYDLRTSKAFDAFWKEFDEIVGMRYLSGIHLNDSKYPFDSRRDVHQQIGLGFIGLECFRLIMNKPELDKIPKVLETPVNDDSRKHEIELLRWLIGRKEDDKDVVAKSIELHEAGASERTECAKQVASKQAKLAFPPLKKAKKE